MNPQTTTMPLLNQRRLGIRVHLHYLILFVLFILLAPQIIFASDHADPMQLRELEAGITDLFAFPNEDNLVIIVCIRRGLVDASNFRLEPYQYEIHIDHHSPVSFDDPDSLARYGGKVRLPAEIAQDITLNFQLADRPIHTTPAVSANPRLQKTMIRNWNLTGELDASRVRVWSGVCDDPFIFFRFSTTNCIAIVTEIPFAILPAQRNTFLIWATSKKFGTQIDHVGRSLRTMLPRFEALNKLHPSEHVRYLRARHQQPGVVDDVAGYLIPPLFGLRHYDFEPDVMIYQKQVDLTSGRIQPAAYPNGRKLQDDVALLCCQQGDCLLYEVSLAEAHAADSLRPTNNAPGEDFLDEFPYLLPANPSPSPPATASLSIRTQLILAVILLTGTAIALLPWVLWWRARQRLNNVQSQLRA